MLYGIVCRRGGGRLERREAVNPAESVLATSCLRQDFRALTLVTGTHAVGEFPDRIGRMMVATLEGHRRRGYGKAVVSATTGELPRQDRVAVWGTETTNVASIGIARSVGYPPLATVFAVRLT